PRSRRLIAMPEVEAATKIRAKVLRALENEEWDLLPGPTFVKTFLRTYAEYLELDPRMLVEEYRQRYERPSGSDLTPFGAGLGAPRQGALVGIAILVGALYLIGSWGSNGSEQPPVASNTPAPTATPTATATPKKHKKKKKAAATRGNLGI